MTVPISRCCFSLTLQAGCTIISGIFFTLATCVFLVNMTQLSISVFLFLFLFWTILMIVVAVTAFLSAYLERYKIAGITVLLMLLTFLYWIIYSLLPLISPYDKDFISRCCLNNRCGESLWLLELDYRISKGYYERKKRSADDVNFDYDDPMFIIEDDSAMIEITDDSLLTELHPLEEQVPKGHPFGNLRYSNKFNHLSNGSYTKENTEEKLRNKRAIGTSAVDENIINVSLIERLFKETINRTGLTKDSVSARNAINKRNIPLMQYFAPVYYDEKSEYVDEQIYPKIRSKGSIVLSILYFVMTALFYIYCIVMMYCYWFELLTENNEQLKDASNI